MRISALRLTEFHQNCKDPIREIQRFPNLGHNLCENDKQTLHGLYLINMRFIPLFWALLKQMGPCKSEKRFRAL